MRINTQSIGYVLRYPIDIIKKLSRQEYCYTFASQSRIKHKNLMTMKNILSKTKAVKNGVVTNANVQSNKCMNGYLTKQVAPTTMVRHITLNLFRHGIKIHISLFTTSMTVMKQRII